MILEGSKGSVFLHGVRGPSGETPKKADEPLFLTPDPSNMNSPSSRCRNAVSELPSLSNLEALQVDWCVHLNHFTESFYSKIYLFFLVV